MSIDKVYYCRAGCGTIVPHPGMCKRCSDELAALKRREQEKRNKAASKKSKKEKGE